MKNIFLILIFCFTITSFSQDKNLIYKNSQQNESPIPVPYNVSVLRLKKDGSYLFKYQKYASKRMMKKNILLYVEEESGKWTRDNDTISLTDSKTNRLIRFLVRGNRLSVIMKEGGIIKTKWKLVKQDGFDWGHVSD